MHTNVLCSVITVFPVKSSAKNLAQHWWFISFNQVKALGAWAKTTCLKPGNCSAHRPSVAYAKRNSLWLFNSKASSNYLYVAVPLEKIIVLQLAKKLSVFYGTPCPPVIPILRQTNKSNKHPNYFRKIHTRLSFSTFLFTSEFPAKIF